MDWLKQIILDKILGGLNNLTQGKKTAIGMLGLLGCYIATHSGVVVPDFVIKFFEGLVGVGMWDKLRRSGSTIDDLQQQLLDIKNSLPK